jgi:hypothetical protein
VTETQAHEFLSWCKRRWLWLKNIGEVETMQKTKRSAVALIFQTLMLLAISASTFFSWSVYLKIALLIFCLLTFSVSTWLLVRLRQARRVLRGQI